MKNAFRIHLYPVRVILPNLLTLNGFLRGMQSAHCDLKLKQTIPPPQLSLLSKKESKQKDIFYACMQILRTSKNIYPPVQFITLRPVSNDKIATFIKLTAVKWLCGHGRIRGVVLRSSSFDGTSVPPSDVVAEASL